MLSGGGHVGRFNDWFCNRHAAEPGRSCLAASPDQFLQILGRRLVIISNPLAISMLQKVSAQIIGEFCSITPAHDKTVVLALTGSVEQPFASKVLIVVLDTIRECFETSGYGKLSRRCWSDRRH